MAFNVVPLFVKVDPLAHFVTFPGQVIPGAKILPSLIVSPVICFVESDPIVFINVEDAAMENASNLLL